MKNHLSGRSWSTFGKLAVLLLLAAVAFDGWPDALAQDDGSAPTSEPEPPGEPGDETPVPTPPGHFPFTAWNDGPEAIPFTSLPPAEQAAVMAQAERSETNSGYEVSQQWSLYSHEMAAQTAAETARRLAGLTGTDDVGVAP